MDTVYINAFENVTTTAPTPATCFGGVPPPSDSLVVAASPDYDPGLLVQFGNLGAVKLKLGAMKTGSSSPALGSICPVPSSWSVVGIVDGRETWQIDPAHLQVTVCQNPNVNAANPVPQSQTLYLVPGKAHDVLTPFLIELRSPFVGPGTLTAELIFDSPEVSGGVGDDWAVALNFKQNGQNDGGAAADAPFGPTCQFSGTGTVADPVTVKLNKVVDGPAPSNRTSYQDYQNTTFTLTTSLSVDQAGNVSGVASLLVGPQGFHLPVPVYEVQSPGGFDLQSVNAVGVAVVNLKNTYTWVRVNLRKFTLYATPPPPVFGPIFRPPPEPPPHA